MCVTVALRLEPARADPPLSDLAAALQEPMRPLFIGRKACLPAAPLYGGFAEGESALAALLATPGGNAAAPSCRLLWPVQEGVDKVTPLRTYLLTDQRNWVPRPRGDRPCLRELPATPRVAGNTFKGVFQQAEVIADLLSADLPALEGFTPRTLQGTEHLAADPRSEPAPARATIGPGLEALAHRWVMDYDFTSSPGNTGPGPRGQCGQTGMDDLERYPLDG